MEAEKSVKRPRVPVSVAVWSGAWSPGTLIPSCGLCPGTTEMLRGAVPPLRQHETHSHKGGSSNRRQSPPFRLMSNSRGRRVGSARSQVQYGRVVADLHHDSDTSRMSRPHANLGCDEGPSGTVEGPWMPPTVAWSRMDTSYYLMKYGRFASYPEAAGWSSHFGG